MSSESKRGVLRVFILIAFVILLSFASITLMGRLQEGKTASPEKQEYAFLEVFNQAVYLVEQNYVKEVDAKTLYYGAIQGMLNALDPHSVYLTPDYFRDMKIELQGQFGGIGIEVGVREGRLSVIAPLEDTPAWRAGFKPGDLIVKIDGVSTEGMNLEDAVHRMRGKVGGRVTITLFRQGWAEPKDFPITREVIQIKAVRKAEIIDGKFGYLRLVTFNDNTSTDLSKAMKELMDKTGGKISGLVLDLRNNPGGKLEQAVEVSKTFISEGLIVSTKGRIKESNQNFYAHKQNAYTGFPMVVLVNAGSASASEIVAAAIKDSGRGILLGAKTYGKGSVQSLYTLKDGSGMKITTAYYYTPSGKSIQAEGITPDIVVEELSPEDMARLEQERRLDEERRFKEENLPGYIKQEEAQKNKSGEKTAEPPEREEVGFEELALKDYQLRRAIEILKSWEVFQANSSKTAQ